ncbi:AAA family ATPase [Pseudomonas typographi]|uniref:AAA family ATPase n=1 Tax=Pseudomonas typographi TaxID=2715964 RepID=A0ABR7Z194_9PSED|nr:AAA family ATPase [Pseudomonas typographi]MBD1587027.1 AAA family ATPase [Pseudomonas typographi]MBD1599266.1 AAA family ATPase [Pseudomonas typographi]
MKVVTLLGPESTGKSALARHLQARLGGEVVEEYVRTYVAALPRDTTLADVTPIAEGQLAAEDAARARQPSLLLLDTHLLSNRLWSLALFGACPGWLEPELLRRRYDLALVLSPDGVPWCADGQRCQPVLADRVAFFEATVHWLGEHAQPYRVISGNWRTRETEAQRHIAALLKS